jgi:peptidoglycan/LPS O-acetylase OafA/YrhL
VQTSNFRPDIEGLRALAILFVVAYHAGLPGVGGGFVGVDVFFVISGYLITSHLAGELKKTGTLNFREFYARRARRLLPAAGLLIAVVLTACALLLSPLELASAARNAAASALYMSNFWYIHSAWDYFAPGSDTNPFLHTWSLAVEEQFYLVWPLMLLALSKIGGRRGVIGGIALVTIVSLIACWIFTDLKQPWAFYGSPFRAWEFGIGGLACFVTRRIPYAAVVSWIGLALMLAAGCLLDDHMVFPGWRAIIPAVGTVLVLMCGTETAGARRFLSLPPLQYVGQLSYSFYLWHWPVIVLARTLYPELGLAGRITALVIAFGLSIASYKLVESPIRFSRFLKPRASWSVAGGLALTAVAALASTATLSYAKQQQLAPEQREIATAIKLRSGLDDRCLIWLTEDKPQLCSSGSGAKVLVLFGDSHAAQWFSPVQALAQSQGWRLVTVLKSSCPAADVPPLYVTKLRRSYYECSRWRKAAIAQIRDLKPDLVIIASHHAPATPMAEREDSAAISAADWSLGLSRTIQQLGGLKVAVLRDTPFAGFDVPGCISRKPASAQGRCALSRATALDDASYRLEQSAIRQAGGVSIDLSDFFCAGSVCPPVRDDIVVYRDTNHISEGYARRLAPVLQKQMVPLMLQPHATVLAAAGSPSQP